MADVITQDDQGRTYRNGVLQVNSHPSPGVGGAISDMIGALARYFNPGRQLAQRSGVINQAVDDASGGSQTADLGNQF